MASSDDRRAALRQIGTDYAKHMHQTGTAVPSSREIERRVADIGRRADRQDTDRKPKK